MRLFWFRFLSVGLLCSGLAGCPQPPVEICNNGVDDDGDLLADCEDSDCAQVQECLAEICDNGVDDNADLLADCQDPQCLADPICDAAPVAQDDTASTDEDTALSLSADQLLANDADGDGDTLSVSAVANAQNGVVALNGADITFTPDADFFGAASFEYTVDDGNGNSDSALVTVTVAPVNDAPVADDITVTTDEDLSLNLSLTTLDADGDALSFIVLGDPTNGVLSGTAPDLVYTPNPDFHGADSFSFLVNDGGASDTGAVSITVDPVSDVVAATDDDATTDEGAAVTTDVLANDLDLVDGGILVSIVAQPTDGAATVNADNTITYTPDADVNGSDIYTYSVEDIDGDLDTALVTVTVNPISDAPVAVADSFTTDEDVVLVLADAALLANDSDPDGDSLTPIAVADAQNGIAALIGGQITYTPNTNFNGTDSFDYVLSDGQLTAIAQVAVTVNAVNDAPLAADDTASTDEDDAFAIPAATLLANDSDVENDTLTIVSVQNGVNGAAFFNGTVVTFNPDEDFNGAASFTYTVEDGNGGSGTGLVALTVNPVDDCGDSVLEASEECDDGNTTSGDSCSNLCVIEFCGDGVVQAGIGEECDDANATPGDGCENDCTFTCASGSGADRVVVDSASTHCFAGFDGTTQTFDGAESLCQSLGGHLPSVQSAAENALVRAASLLSDNPWLGADDRATEGSFVWGTAEPFFFTNFASGEPDDDSAAGVGGDCLSYTVGNDLWRDTNCDVTGLVIGTVCELDLAFEPLQAFAAGDGTNSVVLADLNGDGDPDLVAINVLSDTVSVFRGNGAGSFELRQTLAAGGEALALAIADIDSDGALDLVTTNFDADAVSLFLGNISGTFSAPQSIAAGDSPSVVAIEDLNNDGDLDLVVANTNADAVSVLLGNGNPNNTFPTRQTFSTGDLPSAVAIGDINNDGALDLVVANQIADTVSLLLGNGDGSFSTQQTFPVGDSPRALSIADLNGDGLLDLVSANANSNNVSVLLGNGSFSTQQTFPVGVRPRALAIADLDSDGDLDLVTTNESPATVSVLLGNGGGSFQPQQTFPVGDRPISVAVGDLNNDGALDLVAADPGADAVSVLLRRF